MGVDVQLQLIDRAAFARLQAALERWRRARDPGPLAAVLREALAKASALAPARAALGERERELERRIDALPQTAPPAFDAEWPGFQGKMEELTRRVQEAQQRGDAMAAFEAMQEASRVASTAFRSATAMDPARTALVRELVSLHEDPPGPDLELADLEGALSALEDRAATPARREEAVSGVEPWLVRAQAIAWDREPRADVGIGRGSLPGWLIDCSNWLGTVVAGGGPSGELLGDEDGTQLFTRDEVLRFQGELARLPRPPDSAIADRLARVRRLVDLAAADPGLALGFRVC